jgi:hypothetical protein
MLQVELFGLIRANRVGQADVDGPIRELMQSAGALLRKMRDIYADSTDISFIEFIAGKR